MQWLNSRDMMLYKDGTFSENDLMNQNYKLYIALICLLVPQITQNILSNVIASTEFLITHKNFVHVASTSILWWVLCYLVTCLIVYLYCHVTSRKLTLLTPLPVMTHICVQSFILHYITNKWSVTGLKLTKFKFWIVFKDSIFETLCFPVVICEFHFVSPISPTSFHLLHPVDKLNN